MVKARYICLAIWLLVPLAGNAIEGDWEHGGRMLKYRRGGGLVALSTGDLLAVAGDGLMTAELISQRVLTEPRSAVLPGPVYGESTIAVLHSGEVLVGGYSSGTDMRLPMVYNHITNSWRPTSSPVEKKVRSRALLVLKNGKVLAIGGCGVVGPTETWECGTKTVEIYDPGSDSWSLTGSLLEERKQPGAVLLPSSRVLVFAGGERDNRFVDSVTSEIYDPDTGVWTRGGDMVRSRYMARGALLESGKVVVIGGLSLAGEVRNVEIYDPELNSWTEEVTYFDGNPFDSFGQYYWPYAGPVLLSSGKVLIMYHLGYGLIYDPGNNMIAPVKNDFGGDVCGPRDFMAALAPSGKVLFAGGLLTGGCQFCNDDPELRIPCHMDLRDLYWYDTGTPSWCKVCLANGNCVIMDEGLYCDDGNIWTTGDHCDGKGNCVSGPWDAGVDGGADGGGAGVDAGDEPGGDGGSEDVFDAGASDVVVRPDAVSTDGAGSGRDARHAMDSSVSVFVHAPGCGCAAVGL